MWSGARYFHVVGVYLKAALEQEKAALLVAIGVKADGHKVVLAVTSGYRCWNHRLVNLLTQVPKQRQGEARELLTKIPYQASARQTQQKKRVFQNWCLEHGYERAAELIAENWEQMVTFYRFPRGHWRTCERAAWSSRRSRRCGCVPTRRSDSKRSPMPPLWYGRCCWSPNASFGASTRPSYCRPWPPGSSITTAYRSEEVNTRRPPA